MKNVVNRAIVAKKHKLFTLFLALAASAGTIFAEIIEHVQIGDLYYNLNTDYKTAEVTWQCDWWFGENYSGLSSVTIPSAVEYDSETYSVTSIIEEAFRYCTSLSSVTIPNSVTSIGRNAFTSCIDLSSIVVANGNTIYDSRDNCNAIIETATNILIVGCKNTKIPHGVTSIGFSAFGGYTTMSSIIIPNSVISIERDAFFGCSSLTSLIIPFGVINIGINVFYSCTGLKSVNLPNSVTNIGSGAFYDCSGLTSITCEAINPPALGSGAFEGVIKSIPLYVPAGSIIAYQAADQWSDFTNIQAIVETEEVNCNIRYVDKDASFVSSEQLTFNVPEAPEFDGFTFLRWEFVGGPMSDGLTIQAFYQANEPTSAPAVVVNPANPAQKLIRDGNVYILKGDKTYTLQGQTVR